MQVRHLEGTPAHSDYEPVARIYKNAFGIDETIILHQNYWNYFDWLIKQGEDMDEWVQECDLYRDDKSLSENLMEWLYWDECERHRKGLNVPSEMPPYGYLE